MSDKISLSEPVLNGNEWKYVKQCIDTGWVSSAGKYVELFEKKISEYVGSNFAVATINGTSALHIALLIAGVKEDDEVIVPTLTFIAPINAVKYVGASPIFMDADNYFNMDIEKTIDFIKLKTVYKNGFTYNKITGKRISAIIPVHIFGNAVLLDELIPFCKERNIRVIEDASESVGTYYIDGAFNTYFTGAIGDIGVLSFNGNKIITTGGGGMILTNNSDFAEKARYLTTQAKDDAIKYIHNRIGYNYRLSNINAAIGVAQLEQIEDFISKKEKIYFAYKEGINNIKGLKIAERPKYARNNNWLNILVIDENKFGKSQNDLLINLIDNGIEARPIWYLNHLQKPYKNYFTYKIENAYKLLNKSIVLPSSISLNIEEINYILTKVKE